MDPEMEICIIDLETKELLELLEQMSQKYERMIGDPQMLSHDSQTEFSVLQMAFCFTNRKLYIYKYTYICKNQQTSYK